MTAALLQSVGGAGVTPRNAPGSAVKRPPRLAKLPPMSANVLFSYRPAAAFAAATKQILPPPAAAPLKHICQPPATAAAAPPKHILQPPLQAPQKVGSRARQEKHVHLLAPPPPSRASILPSDAAAAAEAPVRETTPGGEVANTARAPSGLLPPGEVVAGDAEVPPAINSLKGTRSR